jgi:hypothetical protein
VVVIGLHAEVDALIIACLLCRLNKVLWQQLSLVVEVVAGTLLDVSNMSGHGRHTQDTHHIDEHLQRALPLLHELCCVVLFPLLLLVFTKVSLKGLLPPWAVDWVGNRCECGDRLVHSRVLEELKSGLAMCAGCSLHCAYQCQSSVAAHAVSGDADFAGIELLE